MKIKDAEELIKSHIANSIEVRNDGSICIAYAILALCKTIEDASIRSNDTVKRSPRGLFGM